MVSLWLFPLVNTSEVCIYLCAHGAIQWLFAAQQRISLIFKPLGVAFQKW